MEKKKRSTPSSSYDYSRLGENIRNLRINRHETQEELGFAIGMTKAAISNYENGIRTPDFDELDALARHFMITPSKLITGDFSHLNDTYDILINDPNNRRIIYETLMPIFCSEEAMENEHFKRACELHIQLFESICNSGETPSASTITYMTELYQQAAEEHIIDAYANLLWWPMYESIGLYYHPSIMNSSDVKAPDATLGDVYRAASNPNLRYLDLNYDEKKMIEEQVKFEAEREKRLDTHRNTIILNIYHLKNSNDLVFTDLADYYIALGYIFDILNDRLTTEENRVIGHEMMRMCFLLRNCYAENYYETFICPKDNKPKDNK